MSYKALYRTYRPNSFEDVVGQKHIIATLMNAVKQNKMAHAYLLCGPRGTGKTTVARLLAKAVNCESKDEAPCNRCSNCVASDHGTHADIVEIDAASSSGVDQIRDLIEKVKYSPIQGHFKVYIIDEVHMLSQGAFNALLKTLEEPPSHVIFVLATTEPHKVLPTIISRCQRYDFGKVSQEEIISRLRHVATEENIKVDDEALRMVAVLSDGGMRDALSILDQCIAYAQDEITVNHVNDIYGITTIHEKIEMIENIFNKDAKTLLNTIQILSEKGIDIRRLTSDLVEVLKESVIYTYTKDKQLLRSLSEEEVKQLIINKPVMSLLAMIDILMETTVSYRNASNVTSYFEVAILKMIASLDEKPQNLTETINTIPVQLPKVEVKQKIEETPKIVIPEIKVESIPVESDGDELSTVEILPQEEVIEDDKDESQIDEIAILHSEFILGMLVAANKETKEKDKEKWLLLGAKSREISCAKCATILKFTEIVASGDDFLVVVSDTVAEANQINDMHFNQELYYFLKDDLGIDKMIYALEKKAFQEITLEFKERWGKGDLPPAAQITKYRKKVESKEKKKTSEEKVIDLFGLENITILEEE